MRLPQAHVVVPDRLPGRARGPPPAGAGVDADRARRRCSAGSTQRPSSSPAASGSSAATPTARSRSPCPTATSTTVDDLRRRPRRRRRDGGLRGLTRCRLVLASGSPRRRELLALLGLPFEVVPADVDESVRPGEAPVELVRRLALAKADAIAGWSDDVRSCSPPTRPSTSTARSSASRPTTTTPGGCCGHCRRGPTWSTRRSSAAPRRSDGAGRSSRRRCRWPRCPTPRSSGTWRRANRWTRPAPTPSRAPAEPSWSAIDGSASNVVGLPLATVVELLGRQGVAVAGAHRLALSPPGC